ncbi:unnamed protein product, partial [Tilletia laevis]
MNRSASDRGAALASDGSAEAGLSSRATSSVSRKSGGRLLASLGFNFGGGGSRSRSRGTSESDEVGAQQQTPSRGNRARHARGTSLSLVDPGLAPASAGGGGAGRRHRHHHHHHHHTRAQSTSVESGLLAPSAPRTGSGAGRRTSLGGPAEDVVPAAVITPGGGVAARDRGWELFYSRGLELESDWERLASPAGGGGGAGGTAGATAASGAG